MTYYCVTVEYYDSGKVLACVTSREANEKPNNQHRRVQGVTVFRAWLQSKRKADELCQSAKAGNIDIDTMLQLFRGWAVERMGVAA